MQRPELPPPPKRPSHSPIFRTRAEVEGWAREWDWKEKVAAALQQRKPGRPRVGASGLCVTAHRMRIHEDYDNEDVARQLYPELYALSPTEARRKSSDAASKGRGYCPDCGKKPPS